MDDLLLCSTSIDIGPKGLMTSLVYIFSWIEVLFFQGRGLWKISVYNPLVSTLKLLPLYQVSILTDLESKVIVTNILPETHI